jgi:hypothetical protein
MSDWVDTGFLNKTIAGVVGQALPALQDALLNTFAPRNFEMYVCTLELRKANDSIGLSVTEGKLISTFTFPINPTGIQKMEPALTQIKKTFTAISVVKTEDFVPQTITIRGDFGRGWSYVLTNPILGLYSLTLKDGVPYKRDVLGALGFYTGFGCIKQMQSFFERSVVMDDGMPRTLYFYNHALSEGYQVEVKNVSLNQDVSKNRIWSYEVVLDIVDQVNGWRNGVRGVLSMADAALDGALSKLASNMLSQINLGN